VLLVFRTDQDIRHYYNEFSTRYDARRGTNDPNGYHSLIDDLEVDFVAPYAQGKRILEAGCGTGLLLERLADVANHAEGFDLSDGMLAKARERGLHVKQGSITEVPYQDAEFDVVYSFKVLPHVPEIKQALQELVRVTKPGGYIIAEFYNPYSLRSLAKHLGPAGAISQSTRESAVFTRFDSPWKLAELFPTGCRPIRVRGARIVTPTAYLFQVPALRNLLVKTEWKLADSPLAYLGGFFMTAFQKPFSLPNNTALIS
jgi:ubiquinone/menaquinone biosynthesis C-methylase UbiE